MADIVNQAVAGHTEAKFFLTLDQSKFFDRLDLQLLYEMCQHFGLQHGHYLINGYEKLRRHIFIDGSPTTHILHGTHTPVVFRKAALRHASLPNSLLVIGSAHARQQHAKPLHT